MNTPRTRLFGSALACMAVALAAAAQPEGDDVRARRALDRLGGTTDTLAAVLIGLDDADLAVYEQHVVTLSGPFFGGRLPGTIGIERAADYIEQAFADLGLDPAFPTTVTAADGTEVITARDSFRQHMPMGERLLGGDSSLNANGRDLTIGKDFDVIGMSGDGSFSGPAVFVGYSIPSGPGGYLTFNPVENFEGKAVIMLAFEPMDEAGRSLWSDSDWSGSSRLVRKFNAAARRGAAAIILVTPPQANDPAVNELIGPESKAPGKVSFDDIPIIHVTPAVADSIIRAGDPDHRSLARLIAQANREGVVVDLPNASVEITTALGRTPMFTDNLGAILPGRGSLASEFVVIGGHYDHIGDGTTLHSNSPDRAGQVHPGADDNASGTSGVLLAARVLTRAYAELGADDDARSILFLTFTAEESGLLGSAYYTEHPAFGLDRHTLMLNMDMIGRLREDNLLIGNLHTGDQLDELTNPIFAASGLTIGDATKIGAGRSDHSSFNNRQIPNLFFFTGFHDDYHAASDTHDKINEAGAVRVVEVVCSIAFEAATRPEAVGYATEDETDTARPTVYLGILPANHDDGGVLIRQVRDEGSAKPAGLLADDRIIAWNGDGIADLDALRPKLTEHKPGDVVTLTIVRDGETIEVVMTLQ